MSVPPDESVSIDIAAVIKAVAKARNATRWSGSYAEASPVATGVRSTDAAIERAVFLVRNLPRRYSTQLGVGLEAITQAAIDTELADGQLDVRS